MYILKYANGLTLTARDIKGNIDLLHQVNPDTGDLILGVAGMAELKVNIFDNENRILPQDIIGNEFTFSRCRDMYASNTDKTDLYTAINPDLMVINNNDKYCVFKTVPYFKIIKGDIEVIPTQPPKAVESIYIDNNKVYLLHQDYTTSVYSLAGAQLENYTLTDFEKSKVRFGEMINIQGNTVYKYGIANILTIKKQKYIEFKMDYEQVGIFKISDAKRSDGGTIAIVAHDKMKAFEITIDSWINTIPYPITTFNLLKSLCSYIGVNLANTSITNGSYSIIKKFAVDNTTARTLLQWICELSANFAYFDSVGKLHVEFYKQSSKVFSTTNYKMARITEYTTGKIDKVQVKVQDNDIGVIVPLSTSGTNTYIIQNNPLMYTSSDAELRPIVTAIYNKIKDFTYIPIEFQTVLDNKFSADIGNIITLETVNGNKIQSPIMVKHIVGDIETYISTGNLVRSTQSNSLNQAIQMLNGRTSQLVDTVDEFSKTLTEVKSATETNTTQIKLTQGKILLKVDANGIISAINMSPEEIQIDTSRLNIRGLVTISDLENEGQTVINGSNITTGIISADIIEASTGRVEYLTIGKKMNEDDVFPTRIFPNGIRWEDNSYLLSNVDDGVQTMTLASTGKKVTIGAEYQVVASSSDEGTPTFMVIPNPAIEITKDLVKFLKQTNLVWRGTLAQYNALTAEQKSMYLVEVIV